MADYNFVGDVEKSLFKFVPLCTREQFAELKIEVGLLVWRQRKMVAAEKDAKIAELEARIKDLEELVPVPTLKSEEPFAAESYYDARGVFYSLDNPRKTTVTWVEELPGNDLPNPDHVLGA